MPIKKEGISVYMLVSREFSYDRTTNKEPVGIFSTIKDICATEWPECPLHHFTFAYNEVVKIFQGKHVDFLPNTLPYHNLRHTVTVTLATARLLHGLKVTGEPLTGEDVEKTLISALFHDIGLLRTNGKTQLTCGLKSQANHELISSDILTKFVIKENLPAFISEECEEIIAHTNITISTADISCSPKAKLIGQIVGTADITSQMADRYYAECLAMLFIELEETGECEFESLGDMFEKTESFLMQIETRLNEQFGGIQHKYQDHFREFENDDRNLYIEGINKNLVYIKKITKAGSDNFSNHLRRTPPCLEQKKKI